MIHLCYCGKHYECPFCGTPEAYICPTINDDEDGNLCESCLDKAVAEMQAFWDADNGGD